MKSKNLIIIRAILIGCAAALSLLAFYFLLVGFSSRSWQYSLELLTKDRYYAVAIAAGFGGQLGLLSYVRQLKRRVGMRGAVATTTSGTGTSTVSMVACCLHHLGDFVPILGASGAAIFFEQYRYPVMLIGIGINASGIFMMLRLISRNRLWPSQVFIRNQ